MMELTDEQIEAIQVQLRQQLEQHNPLYRITRIDPVPNYTELMGYRMQSKAVQKEIILAFHVEAEVADGSHGIHPHCILFLLRDGRVADFESWCSGEMDDTHLTVHAGDGEQGWGELC